MKLERKQAGVRKADAGNVGSLEIVARQTQRAANIANPERSLNHYEPAATF
jgi:hypothetical protein